MQRAGSKKSLWWKNFWNISIGNPFSHKILLDLAHKKSKWKSCLKLQCYQWKLNLTFEGHHGLEILYEIQSGQVLVFTVEKIRALCNYFLERLKTRFS